MMKDAIFIMLKDLKCRQVYLGCMVLAITLIVSSFGFAATGMESFAMSNMICWLVFPIAIGPIIAVPAGSKILANEISTHMLEVLVAAGVSPLAFIVGKILKPILWGVATSTLAYIAAQIGFTFFGDNSFVLYGFGLNFVLTSLTSIIAASLFLISFAIALSNESIYSAAAICLSIGPLLLLCNNYAMLGLTSPTEILPFVTVSNFVLCVTGLAYALWQLRPGSSHWMTSS